MGLFSLGDTLSSSNQDSPIGKLGEPIQRWTDPLSWITGGKWADWTSKDIPRATNQIFSPITQFAGSIDKRINPVRQIPIVDKIGDTAEAKPGDTVGLAIGSFFTGGALDGALAGSGGSAAGAGAAGAADAGAGAAAGSGTAGASGLTGFLSGPAAYGDAGLTGTTTASGSGLSSALGSDLGGSLGSSPTGLFSGLLPGGGMTGTSSGALGGGLSGSVAGGSSIGGASMGGVDSAGLYQQLLSKALNQASKSSQQTANADANNMAQLPAARQGTPTNALAAAALDAAQAQRIAASRQSTAARAVSLNPYLQYGK